MKILQLYAENVKRIKAIEIHPDKSLVVVSGRNAQGKSSCMDSIMFAIAGAAGICKEPIRKGAKKARVKVWLGDKEVELIVERKFMASGSTLTVTDAEGTNFASPQKMLDTLFGALTFDPLEFTRSKAASQLETLKQIVGLDFAAIDRARSEAYSQRTQANREVSRLEAQLGPVTAIHRDVPTEEVSIADLAADYEKYRAENENITTMRKSLVETTQRWEAQDAVMQAASKNEQDLADDMARLLEDGAIELEASIKRLRESWDIKSAKLRTYSESRIKLARESWETAQKRKQEIEQQKHAYAKALEGLAMSDTAGVRQKMTDAETINRRVRENAARAKVAKQLREAKETADALTGAIEQADEQKRLALEQAKFPIPGLSFDDSGVLLNGLPFDQASSAEQLRASVAIGLAAHPKLRVMLIRDGSLLDEEGMELLAEIAAETESQVWCERVTDGGGVGIVIEDGEVVQAAAEPALPGMES